jgi:SAM-dependent methyltransferase
VNDDDPGGLFVEPLLLDTEAPAPPDPPESAEERARAWPARRIAAAELIWGDDFVLPGHADYTLRVARPLELSPALSLLDLSSGLGGGTRALAEHSGVWITGLERDGDLAEEAHERSREANIEKKAPVRAFDPSDFELKKRSFDCMIARELFYSIADKERLFGVLQRGLKDRGQLAFTDYVLGSQPPSQSFEDWAGGEQLPCYPVSVDALVGLLKSLHFECRVVTDDSDAYRADVVAAWSRLAENMENDSIPRHLLARVVAEADRWGRFLRVLDRSELRVYRFHAVYRQG